MNNSVYQKIENHSAMIFTICGVGIAVFTYISILAK